jgi:hypothetical protein
LESQAEGLRRENLDLKTSCQQQMLTLNSKIESILDAVMWFCTDDESNDEFEFNANSSNDIEHVVLVDENQMPQAHQENDQDEVHLKDEEENYADHQELNICSQLVKAEVAIEQEFSTEKSEENEHSTSAAKAISALAKAYFSVHELNKKKAAASTIASVMLVFAAKYEIRLLKEKELQRVHDLEFKRRRNERINQKGLIRAFCRVKPFLGKENVAHQKSAVQEMYGSNTLMLCDPQGRRSKAYLLDHVFAAEASQDEVFQEVEELIDSALDGNHVCLMAYGQTGSGKTYTMEGTGENPGIIPRAAWKLFDGSRTNDGWTYSFKISAFQIYQDRIEDLLASGAKPQVREMRANGKTSVEIRELVREKVDCSDELLYFFEKAAEKRTTEATTKNSSSSRSHMIFKIDVLGERDGDRSLGHLFFVDLAGSEAASAGKSEKQKKDGADIRNSLTALKTFLARTAKKENGDSRSSSICQYMQYVLSVPDSKLLVIANIAKNLNAFSQTKDALEFVAEISKLKDCKTPAFIAASKAAALHDQEISDQGKPWKAKKK